MSDPIKAALIALCTGVLVALLNSAYNVGGRSALQRRVMKQEGELLNVLPEGPFREELELVLRGRIALYLVRLMPEPPHVRSRRWWRAGWALLSTVFSLATLGRQPGLAGPEWSPGKFGDWAALAWVGVSLFALAVTACTAVISWRRNRSLQRRLRRHEAAEDRLSDVLFDLPRIRKRK